MASRRMFSLRIINSAKFLMMPVSTQLLYFHLGMRADDDGVVEAYTILKQTGATEDDLRVLVSKGYVVVLNDELVSYITDWTEHNKVRADRKVDSIYKNLLLQMVDGVQLLESKPRADTKKSTNSHPREEWTDNGRTMDSIGKDRLGKDSIGKDIEKEIYKEKESKRFVKPSVEEIQDYINEKGYSVDAEMFYDFYESKGWKVGKSPMKDWKASVRTWQRSNKDKPNNSYKQNNNGQLHTRDYTKAIEDAMEYSQNATFEEMFGIKEGEL